MQVTNGPKISLESSASEAAKKPNADVIRKYEDAKQAAEDFESMFVDMMLKSMRSTATPEDASNAHEIYQGMLDGEYAKSMVGSHDFGVRGMVLEWMKNNDPDLAKLVNEKGELTATSTTSSEPQDVTLSPNSNLRSARYALEQYKTQEALQNSVNFRK